MTNCKSLLPLLAGLLLAVGVISCPGNGGASDSGGATYSSGGSGTDSSGSGSATAIDILSKSNEDDLDGLIQLLGSGSSAGGSGGAVVDPTMTNTVTMNADDIGLPTGGEAILTITDDAGNVLFSQTVGADSDGNVTFDVPAIKKNTSVTASLTVNNSAGEMVYGGSKTQTVSDSENEFDIKLTRYLPLSELAAYIAALPTNSPSSPHKLPPISGLTADNLASLKAALQNNTNQYVDLSATTLPEGITDLSDAFNNCQKLAVAPSIPEGVTNMSGCFAGCYYLTTAPVIPASVTNMSNCFQGISSLTGNVIIKANITNSSMISTVFNYGYWTSISVYVVSDAVKDAFLADYFNQSIIGPPGSGKSGIIYDHLP